MALSDRSRLSRWRESERPSWLLGSIAALRRDPLGTLMRAFAEHGDAAPIRLGPPRVGRTLYLLSHPSHVEHVLKTNQGNYRKAPTYLPIKAFLGEGLLTSEGDTWLRHRRLAQRSFYRNAASIATGRIPSWS